MREHTLGSAWRTFSRNLLLQTVAYLTLCVALIGINFSSEKKLIEAFSFVENVKGEDLLQKPWEPDSDLRIKMNIF